MMKQLILVAKTAAHEKAELVVKASVGALFNRSTVKGNGLIMDGKIMDWVRASKDVEVIEWPNGEDLLKFVSTAEVSMLCPFVLRQETDESPVAVGLGPYPEGLLNCVKAKLYGLEKG
ncbi:hypothetical protein ACI2KR_08280 [Pseudomonas luteola]